MSDSLAPFLARQARVLHLTPATLEDADLERLRAFARVTLQELAALGLLSAEPEVGCWTVPRSPGN